ncbi:MAG: hypothetical protein ACTHMY_18015 [Solirubrobacteraceae bacterium]
MATVLTLHHGGRGPVELRRLQAEAADVLRALAGALEPSDRTRPVVMAMVDALDRVIEASRPRRLFSRAIDNGEAERLEIEAERVLAELVDARGPGDWLWKAANALHGIVVLRISLRECDRAFDREAVA